MESPILVKVLRQKEVEVDQTVYRFQSAEWNRAAKKEWKTTSAVRPRLFRRQVMENIIYVLYAMTVVGSEAWDYAVHIIMNILINTARVVLAVVRGCISVIAMGAR